MGSKEPDEEEAPLPLWVECGGSEGGGVACLIGAHRSTAHQNEGRVSPKTTLFGHGDRIEHGFPDSVSRGLFRMDPSVTLAVYTVW